MPGTGVVEVRATNGGSSWSNPLQFHYTDDDSSGASADSELMERQLCLLQQFVQAIRHVRILCRVDCR